MKNRWTGLSPPTVEEDVVVWMHLYVKERTESVYWKSDTKSFK